MGSRTGASPSAECPPTAWLAQSSGPCPALSPRTSWVACQGTHRHAHGCFLQCCVPCERQGGFASNCVGCGRESGPTSPLKAAGEVWSSEHLQVHQRAMRCIQEAKKHATRTASRTACPTWACGPASLAAAAGRQSAPAGPSHQCPVAPQTRCRRPRLGADVAPGCWSGRGCWRGKHRKCRKRRRQASRLVAAPTRAQCTSRTKPSSITGKGRRNNE